MALEIWLFSINIWIKLDFQKQQQAYQGEILVQIINLLIARAW